MREQRPSSRRQYHGWHSRSVRLVMLACLLLLGLAVLWQVRQRPRRLYEEARILAPTNPTAAERLLEQAVAAAGGQFPEAEFLRCRLLAQLGQWDEALGGFSRIKNPSTLPARELAELAALAKSAGVLPLAEFALNAARTPGPHLPNVLRQSIRLHLEVGQHEQVLQECRALLQIVPEDPVAWQVQGAIHLERKRLPEAEAAFREALQRTSVVQQQRPMREQLIRVLLDGGRAEDARAELELLRGAGSLTAEARLMEAYVNRLEGHWDQANETVDWLLANASALELQTRLLRAMLWLDQGQPAKAAPDLELVIARQPHNKEAHNKLAQAYRKLNRPEQALSHAETAQRLTELSLELLAQEDKLAADPGNEGLRQRVAELYESLGQPAKAEQLHRRRRVLVP